MSKVRVRVMTHEKGNSNALKTHFWLQLEYNEFMYWSVTVSRNLYPTWLRFPGVLASTCLSACYVPASFFFLPRERIWKRDAAVAERREEGEM